MHVFINRDELQDDRTAHNLLATTVLNKSLSVLGFDRVVNHIPYGELSSSFKRYPEKHPATYLSFLSKEGVDSIHDIRTEFRKNIRPAQELSTILCGLFGFEVNDHLVSRVNTAMLYSTDARWKSLLDSGDEEAIYLNICDTFREGSKTSRYISFGPTTKPYLEVGYPETDILLRPDDLREYFKVDNGSFEDRGLKIVHALRNPIAITNTGQIDSKRKCESFAIITDLDFGDKFFAVKVPSPSFFVKSNLFPGGREERNFVGKGFAMNPKSCLYYLKPDTNGVYPMKWMQPGKDNWDGIHYELLDSLIRKSEAGTSTVIDSDFRSRLLKAYANVRKNFYNANYFSRGVSFIDEAAQKEKEIQQMLKESERTLESRPLSTEEKIDKPISTSIPESILSKKQKAVLAKEGIVKIEGLVKKVDILQKTLPERTVRKVDAYMRETFGIGLFGRERAVSEETFVLLSDNVKEKKILQDLSRSMDYLPAEIRDPGFHIGLPVDHEGKIIAGAAGFLLLAKSASKGNRWQQTPVFIDSSVLKDFHCSPKTTADPVHVKIDGTFMTYYSLADTDIKDVAPTLYDKLSRHPRIDASGYIRQFLFAARGNLTSAQAASYFDHSGSFMDSEIRKEHAEFSLGKFRKENHFGYDAETEKLATDTAMFLADRLNDIGIPTVVDELKEAILAYQDERHNGGSADIDFSFSLSGGIIYGYVQDNTIHLTPEGINPNTPIHEYAHLWAYACQRVQPERWEKLKEELKSLTQWDTIVASPDYSYLAGDENRIAGEVLAHLVGDKGEELLFQASHDVLEEGRKTFVNENLLRDGFSMEGSQYVETIANETLSAEREKVSDAILSQDGREIIYGEPYVYVQNDQGDFELSKNSHRHVLLDDSGNPKEEYFTISNSYGELMVGPHVKYHPDGSISNFRMEAPEIIESSISDEYVFDKSGRVMKVLPGDHLIKEDNVIRTAERFRSMVTEMATKQVFGIERDSIVGDVTLSVLKDFAEAKMMGKKETTLNESTGQLRPDASTPSSKMLELGHLSEAERLSFLSMKQALSNASIPVFLATQEQKDRALLNLSNIEPLWFSGGDEEFSKAVTLAQNTKGIVAGGLDKVQFSVVPLERHDFAGNWSDVLKQAKSWLKDRNNLPDFITVNSGTASEYKCRIGTTAREKYLSKVSLDNSKRGSSLGIHLSVMQKFQEVLQNSVDVEIHADYAKDHNGKRTTDLLQSVDVLIHVLYSAVELDERVYRVKTILKEYRTNLPMPYAFEVQSTELLPDRLGIQISPNSSFGLNESSSRSVDGAKLLKDIEKSYDKGKLILQESAKIDRAVSGFFLTGRDMASTTLHHDIIGWVDNGQIFLTKEGLNPKTLVHEYTHLWAKAMQLRSPEGWQSIVKTLKEKSPLWDVIQKNPAYRVLLTNDDKTASEVLARLTEFSIYQRVEKLANASILSGDSSDFYELLDDEIRAVETMWEWTGKNIFQDIQFNNINEIQDRVFFDLYSGKSLGVELNVSDIEYRLNNTIMENYAPSPLDLSSVDLTPIEKELVQMVAERSHQAWYAARLREGVTIQDNPLMKPWSSLSAEERASSLDSAEQAVKAAKVKFGSLDEFASGRSVLQPEAIIDAIAENAHEVWAKQRMDAGWTYGEVRDNDAKKHPMLIPYSEVPEKEKEYDRDYGRHVVSSLQTLSRFHYSIGGKDLYLKGVRLINEQGEALLRGVVGTPRHETLNGKEYLYYEIRESDKITMNYLSEEGKALFPENLTRYYIDNSDRDIDLYDLMPVIHFNGRDYLQLRHNIGAAADGTQEFRFECLNPDTWEALLISKTPVEPDHSVKGGLRTGLCDSKGFYQGVDLLISPEGKAGLIKHNVGQDVALAFDRPFNMSDAAADVIVKGENIILQKPSMGNISVFDQKTGACLVNEEQGEIIERRRIPAIGKKETYIRLNGIEIPLKRLVENRKASKLAAVDGKSEHRKGVSDQGSSTSIGNQTEIPMGFIKAVADDELRQDRNRPADPSRSPEKVYDSILYPDENEALGAIGTVGHAVRDENGDKVVVGIRYDEGTGKTICKREKVDDIKKKFGVDDAEDKRNVIIPVKVGDQIHELKVPKNLAEDLARGKSVTVSEIRINYDPFLGACALTKDYQKVHYYELSNSAKMKEARQQKAQAAKQSLSSPEPKKASGGKKI